jgi:hypothetical protein
MKLPQLWRQQDSARHPVTSLYPLLNANQAHHLPGFLLTSFLSRAIKLSSIVISLWVI